MSLQSFDPVILRQDLHLADSDSIELCNHSEQSHVQNIGFTGIHLTLHFIMAIGSISGWNF